MHIALRIILAIIYLFAGLALFFGRKRFREEGKVSNLLIRAGLLVLAAITPLLR